MRCPSHPLPIIAASGLLSHLFFISGLQAGWKQNMPQNHTRGFEFGMSGFDAKEEFPENQQGISLWDFFSSLLKTQDLGRTYIVRQLNHKTGHHLGPNLALPELLSVTLSKLPPGKHFKLGGLHLAPKSLLTKELTLKVPAQHWQCPGSLWERYRPSFTWSFWGICRPFVLCNTVNAQECRQWSE